MSCQHTGKKYAAESVVRIGIIGRYTQMTTIKNQTFDEERALYGSDGVVLEDCAFDGLADGESALKESKNVRVCRTFCNLRYPFWHDEHLMI